VGSAADRPVPRVGGVQIFVEKPSPPTRVYYYYCYAVDIRTRRVTVLRFNTVKPLYRGQPREKLRDVHYRETLSEKITKYTRKELVVRHIRHTHIKIGIIYHINVFVKIYKSTTYDYLLYTVIIY